MSELTDANKLKYLLPDKRWYLFLRGLFRDHTEQKAKANFAELSQEFCLIITIRDPFEQENVYDNVTLQLDEYNFWHSNIKIASDISISLDQ